MDQENVTGLDGEKFWKKMRQVPNESVCARFALTENVAAAGESQGQWPVACWARTGLQGSQMELLKMVIASKTVPQSSLVGGRDPLSAHTSVPVSRSVSLHTPGQVRHSQVGSTPLSSGVGTLALCADTTASHEKVVSSTVSPPTAIEEVLRAFAPTHGVAAVSRAGGEEKW